MLRDENIDKWIDPNVSYEEAVRSIENREKVELESYEVPNLVNQLKNNTIECCMRIEEYQALIKTKGIHRFFKPVEKRKVDDDNKDTVKISKSDSIECKVEIKPKIIDIENESEFL